MWGLRIIKLDFSAQISECFRMDATLNKIRLHLLKSKTWRYLRYVHLREYVARIAPEIETVGVCGAGHGWAELALAVEFPHITFTLTDIISAPSYPNYHRAMEFAWANGIDNVRFSIWDVLHKTKRRFDLVASTEMLEHIKDDEPAAANMREAASKYVYCLVPFADQRTNDDAERRTRALETHGHFVCGYDRSRLESLFPDPVFMAGTYWAEHGQKLRSELKDVVPAEIDASATRLAKAAEMDLINRVPIKSSEAQGIKVLARV